MTREEMWKEFENQLIRETRTPVTMSFDDAEKLTKLGIEETVAKWKRRLEQTRWIPVSERLPEEKGKYLCTTHYAIPPYHVFHPENDIYVDDVSVQKFDGKFIDSVVAWMPLPEPFKGEREE